MRNRVLIHGALRDIEDSIFGTRNVPNEKFFFQKVITEDISCNVHRKKLNKTKQNKNKGRNNLNMRRP